MPNASQHFRAFSCVWAAPSEIGDLPNAENQGSLFRKQQEVTHLESWGHLVGRVNEDGSDGTLAGLRE